ncbi:MAG: acyl-CoA dehydrogenase [Deltaproteobacteria bacterium]|nr:acyl-CoA dehydrogenase [Deltaproteobacteria bacterium]
MPIAISEEHLELARVARTFLADNGARAANRAQLEAKQESLPPFWKPLAELGWTGLHLSESYGGSGFGLQELAVVLEEMGYAVAPGPFLPTVWAAAVIDACGSDALKRAVLPGLASGEEIGAVGLDGALARGANAATGASGALAPFERDAKAPALDDALRGDAGLVLGAGLAKWLVLAVGDDLVVVDRDQEGVAIRPRLSLDPSRRVAEVVCSGVAVDDSRVMRGARATALRLGRTLAAAEASGAAHACSEMAAEYAKVRVQFGRTIGTFQAVKHHCTNIRVDAECATAAAWDAARAELENSQAEMASAVAAAVALPALARACQLNIQVHGGIGYTWEQDAHLYVRRSGALSAIFKPDQAQADVTRLAAAGVKRAYSIDLPPEAEVFRAEVREFVAKYKALPEAEKRKTVARSGYLVPHWPKPYGRNSSAIEQLVIDQEFAKGGREAQRPELGISGWNTLTILQHGNAEQVARWVWPSLEGELEFCQLFSEPNAGSDAAGVQTRAVKVDGGWRVTGQKVWTSGAHLCNRGFATVRTDTNAAKHQGITMMVIDMHAPGMTVRPLKQITGHSHFNEVFFDNVFVPDSDVVGPVNQGWTVARATLGNERVSIGGGVRGSGPGGPSPLSLWQKHAPNDTGVQREVGTLIAAQAVARLLNLRSAARAVAGGERGAEGNITKLLGSETAQQVAALCTRLVGEQGAAFDGEGGMAAMLLLASRGGSIAGGTSEIVRNQIAERILGLPRDPLLK